MQVIHHFAEPEIGMVQTRWTHLNRNYSFLTQVERFCWMGTLFWSMEAAAELVCSLILMGRRACGGGRRSRLRGGGSMTPDGRYRFELSGAAGGWQFKYRARCGVPGGAADRDDRVQDAAGAVGEGLHPDGEEDSARVLKSDAPWHTKLEAWYHLTANISYPLMIVLSVLLMPAMIIRKLQGLLQMLLIDFPLFIASTMSVSTFYLMSQKELYRKSWYMSISSICSSLAKLRMIIAGINSTLSTI